MKKMFLLVAMGLLLACGVRAADTPKVTTLYKNGNNAISYYADSVLSEHGYKTIKFFINNKLLFQMETNDSLNFDLYKTNVKNIVVIKNEIDEMGINKGWYIVNLNNSKYRLVNESYGESDIMGSYIYIDDRQIRDVYSDSGCNEQLLKKYPKIGTGVVKNINPIIRGFSIDNKSVFQAKNTSYLFCDVATGQVGDLYVNIRESDKKFIGISSNLNNIYFSATGKGWTAYYVYDVKANKITKTTLAKINKDKIKLTLVKKF